MPQKLSLFRYFLAMAHREVTVLETLQKQLLEADLKLVPHREKLRRVACCLKQLQGES